MTRRTIATGRNLIIAVVLAFAALASLMAVQGFATNSTDDSEVQAKGVIVFDDLRYGRRFDRGVIVS